MIHLSRPQKQLFRKIYKANTLDCSNMPENQLEVIKYLDDLGFLNVNRESSTQYNPNTGSLQTVYFEYTSVKISEKGKSYIAEVKSDFIRFLIPVTISVCALVISTVSLLLSLSAL